MAKVLITIEAKTDSLIDTYQAVYRELNGVKISRSYVINKVFQEKAQDINGMINEMRELIKQKEALA